MFFAFLFCYAGFSKMIDFENYQVQLAQSPLLSAYAGVVSYAVIILEGITVVLLLFTAGRLQGLLISFALMTAFTVYIWLILNYSDFVPCSCGGILEKMTWDQHLVFNIGCVFLALSGFILLRKEREQLWRHTVALLTVTLLISAGSILGMFLSSEQVIKKVNNFTRRFIQQPFEKEKTLDLGANSYYFAGADEKFIYLGNHTAPQILTAVDADLRFKKEIKISLEKNTISFQSVRTLVQPPYFFVYDGSVPVVFRGKIRDFKAQIFSRDDAYFTQIAVLDSTRIAFKSQESKTQKRTIGLLDTRAQPRVTLNSRILGNRDAGLFASDGNLLYDAAHRQLIYMFFYRNAVIKMDEHLNYRAVGHTIDTVSHATVGEISLKNGIHKMNTPPLVVNKKMLVANGIIFNESNLIGKFEDRDVWEEASIIDLYASDRQMYKGSIYVFSKGKGKTKMSSFFIRGNAMYALFDNALVKLPFSERLIGKLKYGETENH